MSIIMASPPKLRLLPIQDFWISGIKKGFKLNFLLPLYVYVRDNLEELEKNISFVFNLGDTSVTYKISNDEEIHLLDVSNLDYFNLFENLKLLQTNLPSLIQTNIFKFGFDSFIFFSKS